MTGNGTRIRAAKKALEVVLQRQEEEMNSSAQEEVPTDAILSQRHTFRDMYVLRPRRDADMSDVDGGAETLDHYFTSSDDAALKNCMQFAHNLRSADSFRITPRRFNLQGGSESVKVYIAGVSGGMEAKITQLREYSSHPYTRQLAKVHMPFLNDRTTVCVYHDPSETTNGREVCLVIGMDRDLVGHAFRILAAR